MATANDRARQIGAKVSLHARRLLHEARQTTVTTGSHVGRVHRFGRDRWQLYQRGWDAMQARLALGARLHELGQGDTAVMGRIDQLLERIRSLQAAGASSRPIQSELRAERARLGELQLESAVSPVGAEPEYRAAREAREAHIAQQQAAMQSQAALRPADRPEKMRIGVGYAVALLLLAGTVWGLGRSSNDTTPRIGITPQNPIADGVVPQPIRDEGPQDALPAPKSPAEPIGSPPPVFTPPQTLSCFNCNGTGRANCSACFGEGKRTCFQCNGKGQVNNPANNFLKLNCSLCFGTGKQNCTFCQYGKLTCPHCQGSGRTRG